MMIQQQHQQQLQQQQQSQQQVTGTNDLNGGISNSILPAKSRVVRSSTNSNQSLEQIMKKANDIIKRSKNSASMNHGDMADTMHPHNDSFGTLPTAESHQKIIQYYTQQKNTLNSNREGQKVSPFVTICSPETNEWRNSNGLSSDKQMKEEQKMMSAEQEDGHKISTERIAINQKSVQNTYISEADYFFENFDSLIRIKFTSSAAQLNGYCPAESSQNQQNYQDTDNSAVVRTLLDTFDDIRKEEQSTIQQKKQLNALPNNTSTNSVYLNTVRAITSNESNNGSSFYLVPRQTQQTSLSIPKQIPPIVHTPLESLATVTMTTPTLDNLDIEQYLKKPQPAKLKVLNGAPPLHPHPPLPQSAKMNLNGYNTNHVNSQRFKYRHSIKEKENNSEIANVNNTSMSNHNINSSMNNNMSMNQMSSSSQRTNSFMFNTPNVHTHPFPSYPQNVHQRSSSSTSYVNEVNNSSNNINALSNSYGIQRPRFDSLTCEGDRINECNQRIPLVVLDNTNKTQMNYQIEQIPKSYRPRGSSSTHVDDKYSQQQQQPLMSSQRGSFNSNSITNVYVNKPINVKQNASNSIMNVPKYPINMNPVSSQIVTNNSSTGLGSRTAQLLKSNLNFVYPKKPN